MISEGLQLTVEHLSLAFEALELALAGVVLR
jgi:hypothetical protein